MVQPLEVPCLAAGDTLLLRPWEFGDVALVREASSDEYIPVITTVPVPYSQEAGEAFVRRQWERASTGSGYPLVIVRTEDGRPLGTVGLWLKDRGEGRASLGYWVAGSARGRGVAAEALSSVVRWAFGILRIPRLQLYASRGMTPRCGRPSGSVSGVRVCSAVGSRWAKSAGTFMYSMLATDLP